MRGCLNIFCLDSSSCLSLASSGRAKRKCKESNLGNEKGNIKKLIKPCVWINLNLNTNLPVNHFRGCTITIISYWHNQTCQTNLCVFPGEAFTTASYWSSGKTNGVKGADSLPESFWWSYIIKHNDEGFEEVFKI